MGRKRNGDGNGFRGYCDLEGNVNSKWRFGISMGGIWVSLLFLVYKTLKKLILKLKKNNNKHVIYTLYVQGHWMQYNLKINDWSRIIIIIIILLTIIIIIVIIITTIIIIVIIINNNNNKYLLLLLLLL